MNFDFKNKYSVLALSIIFDLIGMIPLLDLVWAPVSGLLMTRLYKGSAGRLAGIFTFVEEILPGTDFIPTFTIMWFYTYVFVKKTDETQVVEVE